MTPSEDPGLVTWALDHAWMALVGLVGVVWKQNRSAMEAQGKALDAAIEAHKQEDVRTFEGLHDEQSTQRGHIGKLFDKLEAHSLRAEDRHHELLKALHEGLSSKADK